MFELVTSKWNFVDEPQNIPSQSGEDSSFAQFKRTRERCIVREYIQNSLDAPVDELRNLPIEVEISLIELDSKDYSTLFGKDLFEHIEACKISCDENENAENPYDCKVEYLKSHIGRKIPCLHIADYNTTGMTCKPFPEPCEFKAGVRSFGASNKGSGVAGGSHGQGKIVGFVASEINAVYYSTLVADGSQYGEGVICLCSHTLNGKTYCPSAFFDRHGGEYPDSGDEIPEVFRRTKQGTSVFVLGYEEEQDSIKLMKQNALRSFWLAIHHKELIITIDGETFNSDNLVSKMKEHFPDDEWGCFDKSKNYNLVEKFNPRPYLINCVIEQNPDDGSHYIFETDTLKYPNLGKAKLYVYKDINIKNYSKDRIVCMRDRKMVIEFQPEISSKGFYGVLLCEGTGSEMLRKMETVTHDAWDMSELRNYSKEIKRKGKKVLDEISAFIKEARNEMFPNNVDTEYTVTALDKYLFSPGNRTNQDSILGNGELDDSANNPDAPISTVAGELKTISAKFKNNKKISLRRKGGAKKKKNTAVVGLHLSTQAIKAPVTQDEKSKDNTPNNIDHTAISSEKENDQLKPIDANDTELQGHDNNRVGHHEHTKKGEHSQEITLYFRVVPRKTDSGLIHRIIINSPKNYEFCSMTISIAGADSDSQMDFSPVNPEYKVYGKHHNILSGFNLVKGKNYIDIKFDDMDFHSLKIKAYEN